MRAFFVMRLVWAHTCGCKSCCELIMGNKVKRNSVKMTDCEKAVWRYRNRNNSDQAGLLGHAPQMLVCCAGVWRGSGLAKTPVFVGRLV